MNRQQETILLTLAMKKGLLSDENLEEADRQEEGKKIDWLLKSGHLDPATLDLLLSSSEFKAISEPSHTEMLFEGSFFESGTPVFPVTNWDRYAFESYLGEGGMGRVFKAFDLRLKRNVALKFMTSSAGGRTYRLIREAQALARIHHDNVCQVYEIGEAQGHLYIAMQYIEGTTLDRADLEGLTLQEKVRIMQEAAEGLHAAHQTGIIHRDIKPANIMIQKREDGVWNPILMDFGLARESNEEGITRTGLIVGTPSYMAPEQAAMDSDQLDRRTDIYSFGATMYNLFAGRAPFSGTTPLEIIRQASENDPEPLKRLNPDIPDDLERIIMKCLEKQRERRYQSAQDLAHDLQRFLKGEPVLARPMTTFQRKFRRIIRSRMATLALIVFAVVAIVYVAVAARSRSEMQERLRLANEFSQEVRYLDEYMRHALTAPLHNIRNERLAVQQRLAQFEKRMMASGKTGLGPGSYVMGRGYLSLRQHEAARSWLQKAIAANYRAPEVDFALGLAMGEIYQKELEEAERIVSKNLRESRKKELEKEYRAPAISLLRSARGLQMESPEYAEALIAFYDRQYVKALEKTSQALSRVPWLYEARILEGKIYSAQAGDARDRGENDNAMKLLLKADESYHEAMTVGRSDPFAYVGSCGVWVQAMNLMLYGAGGDLEPSLKKVRESCELAIQADPDLELAYLELSHSLKLAGEDRIGHGLDPTEYLKESEDLARKVLIRSQRNARAHLQIGMALLNRGRYQYEKGKDPSDLLKEAMNHSKSAIVANPNYFYAHNNLGICHLYLADYLVSRTQDPSVSLQEAIHAFQSAIQVRPDYTGAFNNMGNAYLTLSEWNWTHGKDPYPDALKAMESYKNAVRVNPSEAFSIQNLALAYTYLASYDIERNHNPAPNMQQAIQAHEKAIKLNPGSATGYANLGVALLYRAEYDMQHGKNPENDLNSAIQNFKLAEELNPSDYRSVSNHGSAYVDMAEFQQMLGRDSSEELNQAEQWYKKALTIRPSHGPAWRKLSSVRLVQAEKALDGKKDPLKWIRAAEDAFKKAQEIEPDEYELVGVRAQVELAKARHAAMSGKNPESYFQQADRLFTETIKLDPDNPEVLLAIATLDYREAEWKLASNRNPMDAIQRGLNHISESLKKAPNSASGLLLQGKLQLCKFETLDNEKDKLSAAQDSLDSFQKAVSINSNLQHEVEPLILKVRTLL